MKLHNLKEQTLQFAFFRRRSQRGRRLLLTGIIFAVLAEAVLMWLYRLLSQQIFLTIGQIVFSFFILLLYGVLVCFLCSRNIRGIYRNIFFIVLFCVGVWCYIEVAKVETVIPEKSPPVIITSAEPRSMSASEKIQKYLKESVQYIFSATHHSHMSLAAFFPSRGSYEINADGTINNKMFIPLSTLLLYFVFHAAVYIFASYFIVSLWGYRTTNRLLFWLTRDVEKNVFWCMIPESKMLKLAKDIHKKQLEFSQPVFSVDESEVADPQALFQEMNYQGFCLKLRKPEQIHSNCLKGARHFFLTEDPDWNINMARAFLSKRKKYGIETFAQLYIKISDESRELFFNRWADENNIPGKIEIIVIDEAEMIAEKFVSAYPMLQTLEPTAVNTAAGTIPESEFKVLIIGFGRIGRALLKHTICDSQFIRNLDPETFSDNIPRKEGIITSNSFSAQRERVPFSADIIDCDIERWTIFKHTHKSACQRFNLNFMQMKVLSEAFFDLKWENLKNYNRVIVALGESELNIEVAAAIENIIRKKIALPSSKLPEGDGDPEKQLKDMKKRCFLISPEIYNCPEGEEHSENLFNCSENLFSLFGANYEIFSCENIIEEKLSVMAKLIALSYGINYHETLDEEAEKSRLRHSALREANGLPVIPWNYSFKEFSLHLPPEQKKEIMKSWYTSYNASSDKLNAESMYGRKSSRASASNLKNILTLLGMDENEITLEKYSSLIADENLKNLLGRTEHLRWMAYIMLEGHELWSFPARTPQCSMPNQSKKYQRHATLVEYEDLPAMDKIFPGKDKKTFQQKDLEIIENLPLIYREYNIMKDSSQAFSRSSSCVFNANNLGKEEYE